MVLTDLPIERVHRLLSEILKLEVRHEQVSRLCELPQHVLAVCFMQVGVCWVQASNLKKLKASQHIFFLKLQLRTNLIDLVMVEPAKFEGVLAQEFTRIGQTEAF